MARVEHSRKPEMVAAAAGGPIILQTPPSRPSWTGAAAVVLGLILLLQTWVLSAIYRSLADRDPDSAAAKARSEEQAKLAKAVEELERDRLRLEAERRIIFDLTGRLDLPGGPISKQWEEVRKGAVLEAERAVKFERESAVAKAAAEAIQKKNEELRARIERQQKEIEDLKPYKSKSEELTRRVGNFEKKEKELEEAAHLLKRYENLRERLDRLEESESAAEFWRNVTLMGAVPLALLGWALATFAIRRQSEPPAAPDGAGLPTGASGPPNIGPPAAGGAVRVLSNDVVPPGVAPPGPTGYGSPAPPPGASPRTDEMRFD